jgi:hypothetical protein
MFQTSRISYCRRLPLPLLFDSLLCSWWIRWFYVKVKKLFIEIYECQLRTKFSYRATSPPPSTTLPRYVQNASATANNGSSGDNWGSRRPLAGFFSFFPFFKYCTNVYLPDNMTMATTTQYPITTTTTTRDGARDAYAS